MNVIWIRNLLLGAVAWLIGVVVLQPGWAAALLLLAPLVLFPLGLGLITPNPSGFWRFLWPLQPGAALLLLGAFAVDPGWLAAVFTLPWLSFTLLLALIGLGRFTANKLRSSGELGITAALIFPAVGGIWLVLARFGARPLDFQDIIVLATAVHFHYAGFVLPLLAGLTAQGQDSRASRLAVDGIVSGVPLVALGITLSAFEIHLVEMLAALGMALAAMLAAVLQLRFAQRAKPKTTAMLLAISSLSLLAAMVLAALYATGSYWKLSWLDIPLMLWSHGPIIAFGFALPGLIGMYFLRKNQPGALDRNRLREGEQQSYAGAGFA
jgi:hypothetical protein